MRLEETIDQEGTSSPSPFTHCSAMFERRSASSKRSCKSTNFFAVWKNFFGDLSRSSSVSLPLEIVYPSPYCIPSLCVIHHPNRFLCLSLLSIYSPNLHKRWNRREIDQWRKSQGPYCRAASETLITSINWLVAWPTRAVALSRFTSTNWTCRRRWAASVSA